MRNVREVKLEQIQIDWWFVHFMVIEIQTNKLTLSHIMVKEEIEMIYLLKKVMVILEFVKIVNKFFKKNFYLLITLTPR